MKNILFVCLILLGAMDFAHSQILSIQDGESGRPLEMATISSKNPQAFETTNSKGQADISEFEGAEKIHIRILGYKTVETSYAALQQKNFQLELNATGITMDAVVISGSRWKQSNRDVPSKIISISKKDVALQNPQTAADLLGTSDAVFIQKSQQGGGSPMIRGFSTNRLLYTVDGVRMNTAIFRSGNLQNVISLDPFAMESTEVFFGPGSVIYGSDAIGGVMAFQTLTPELSLNDKPLIGGSAVMRYATANQEKTGHFHVNVGGKKWASVSSISFNDYGDLRMGSNGPEEYLRHEYVQRQNGMDVVISNEDSKVQKPSGYSQINMMQKFRFKPNEKWDFQYGFHYSATSEYGRYDRHLRTRNGLPRYGEWSYGPQKWMMNNLNITNTSNNKAYDEMSIRLAHQAFEESRISRNFNSPDRETRIEKVNAYSGNIDFIKSIGSRNKLFYGVEGVYNDVNSTGINEDIVAGTSSPGASRYPQASWASYAAYVSNQFRVSEKILLQAGLRYNHILIDAEFDTAFYPFPFTEANLSNGALTGSFGVVCRPNSNWVISSNFATAFRSPNVDDMGKVFDSEPGAVVVPNPDLSAEYAYNIDLGIAKIFGDVVKIDVTGYYTHLRNALVRRDYVLNGQDSIFYENTLSQVQAIQNAAVANVYGVQAGLEVKFLAGVSFSSNFNYQMGEEELDDGTTSASRHAPPMFGVSRLNYRYKNLSLQFYAVYSAARKFEDMPVDEVGKTEIYATDENGNPWSPGWYTLNFKALYQITDFLSVSAGLENLSDQRYRPYSSGLTAPGRNFILSLRASF
ncbi:MAG: TonB-dependent receptor [Chitinophagales bacterium]